MKKYIILNIDYAGGESLIRPESACDFMLVESIPEDAPVENLYVEVNPTDDEEDD